MLSEFDVAIDIDAPPEAVWDYVTDWGRQGEWIPLTRVRKDGETIIARTGIGPLGFEDTMEVRGWDPPHMCETIHTGRVVRGIGIFECRADLTDPGRTRFVWTERAEIPGGPVAPLLWRVAKPGLVMGFNYALRRLRDRVESDTATGSRP